MPAFVNAARISRPISKSLFTSAVVAIQKLHFDLPQRDTTPRRLGRLLNIYSLSSSPLQVPNWPGEGDWQPQPYPIPCPNLQPQVVYLNRGRKRHRQLSAWVESHVAVFFELLQISARTQLPNLSGNKHLRYSHL